METEILNDKRAQELYKLISTLKPQGKVKIGFNESIKAINNNMALIVVAAKDSVPACLTMPLPVLCEQKSVQYVFVDSKTALGKACGLEIDVLSCAIIANRHEDSSKLSDQISKVLK